MLTTTFPGVDAYREACRRQPSLVQDSPSSRRVGLYGWRTGPTKEIHIAKTQEVVLSVHLGGARRVRVFTEEGLSRSFSKPGDVTLIPSGKPVAYRTEGEVEFATLHFPTNELRDDVGAVLTRLQACHFAVPDDYIASSVRTLMRVARTPGKSGEAYVAALFDALALHVAHLVDSEKTRGDSLVQLSLAAMQGPAFDKAIEKIEAQLAEKLTLNDLADVAGVCRSTFAEQFSERYGCSPHKYIMQRRIERAKALLIEGRMSITDIAYEVGFSGQSHFSTTFRAMTGVSPSTYLQENLATS